MLSSTRNGNFNSSEIVALMDMGTREMTEAEKAARPKSGKGSRTTTIDDPESFGDKAMTFIAECNMERRLGRSLTPEVDARPLTWGKLLEPLVHEKLPTSYEYFSDVTEQHPTVSSWVGTADFKNHHPERHTENAIGDSKCPLTLKSFCQLVDPWYEGLREMDYWNAVRFGWTDKNGVSRKKHDDGDKFFYQLVSNACIYGTKYAELIVFMPYLSELDRIRTMASIKGVESGAYWIWSSPDEKLPYLIDGGYYKDLNIFRFEVPFLEKQALHNRVVLGEKKLIPFQTPVITENAWN